MAKLAAFRSEHQRAEYFEAYDRALAMSPVPVEESDVSTPYGSAHTITAGDPTKPALIALHGKTASSTMWLAHLSTLTATHRVILVDTVGDMNKSVATRVVGTRADVVTWLDSVLDEVEADDAALLGHSYGAWMATTYAMARPDRVERLAILAPAAVFQRVRPAWIAHAVYVHMIRPKPEIARRFIATCSTSETADRLAGSSFGAVVDQYVVGVPRFKGSMGDARPCTYSTEDLAALTMPVLVVIGAEESVCDGPRSATMARTRCPNARVELLANANHNLFADQSAATDALLAEFFAA